MLNLADLPEIDFVEADAQNIEKSIFALYTSVTGRNLAEGDPIRLFLLFILFPICSGCCSAGEPMSAPLKWTMPASSMRRGKIRQKNKNSSSR